MLQSFLLEVKDHRRRQGQRYQLGHILLFSVFAILSGANSYRSIESFIKIQYEHLDALFSLNWKGLPAYSTIRNILQGVDKASLEESFRNYSSALVDLANSAHFVSIDGKVLRGSFDNFQEQSAVQILSVFLTDSRLILAHEKIADKTNEIPVAQELIEELALQGCIVTLDSMHCQKKH